ncbi:U4/U6 small nuclear ribonucleoprotein Prp31, partial [Vespula squamosa]
MNTDVSLVDELGDLEDNYFSSRMVEGPEEQIFIHQTLRNLLKMKPFWSSLVLEFSIVRYDHSHFREKRLHELLIQLLKEGERDAICRSCDETPSVLRRKNATLVVAKDTSAARIDASHICTNGHIGQLRTNRPDFPSPNSSESIEEEREAICEACDVSEERKNYQSNTVECVESRVLELLRLQKYGVLRRKTARIVAAKGTSVARLDASHEITDGYIGQLRIRGPSLTKIVSQKCKTDT